MKRFLFLLVCTLAVSTIVYRMLPAANFLYPVTQPVKLYSDGNGSPLNNGYIYFGSPNQNPETTPIQMYWDAAGTQPAAQPIRTIAGYISRQGTPANIYATGDFSVTVRDQNKNLLFTLPTSPDLQLAQAVAGGTTAAAIPLADSGNYYSPKNVESAFQQLGPLLTQIVTALAGTVPTGTVANYCGSTAPTGWVFVDGKSIGDVASGATERANADTVNLYVLEWNSYPHSGSGNPGIQDSSGNPTTYGTSASNDFSIHKRLLLPDARGRVLACLDNLGGSTASRITVAGGNYDGTVMGNSGGLENHTLTVTETAAHTHTATVTDPGHIHAITDPGHTHAARLAESANIVPNSGSGTLYYGDGSSPSTSAAFTGISVNSHTTGITVGNANTGGGAAHSILQPTIIFTAIIKL